jgi:dUTP pyrophosphatase
MLLIDVKIKKLAGFEDFKLPEYATPGACAVDLFAATEEGFLIIRPGDRALISTGISIALPEGYEAQIRPRSGLAKNKGLSIVNSPGTIDSDYRGPVGVILINHGEDRIIISRGERIAQMVVAPVTRANWIESELCETERGAGGFGSTGT